MQLGASTAALINVWLRGMDEDDGELTFFLDELKCACVLARCSGGGANDWGNERLLRVSLLLFPCYPLSIRLVSA